MFLLQNFCKVDLLDQQPSFKISSIGAPLKGYLRYKTIFCHKPLIRN